MGYSPSAAGRRCQQIDLGGVARRREHKQLVTAGRREGFGRIANSLDAHERCVGDPPGVLASVRVVIEQHLLDLLLGARPKGECSQRGDARRVSAAGGRPCLTHRGNLSRQIRSPRAAYPTIRETSRPAQRLLTLAADEQLRTAWSPGPRPYRACKATILTGPNAFEFSQLLGMAATAGSGGHTRGLVVVGAATQADSQHEPPAREAVQRGRLFRQDGGIAIGGEHHGGHQPNTPGDGCRHRQGDQWLIVAVNEPVQNGERGEAVALCSSSPFEGLLHSETLHVGWQADTDFHRGATPYDSELIAALNLLRPRRGKPMLREKFPDRSLLLEGGDG